jgi:hypothetical protein
MRIWYVGANDDRGECEYDDETYLNLARSGSIIEMGVVTGQDIIIQTKEGIFEKLLFGYSIRDKEDADLDVLEWIEKTLIVKALEFCDWRQDKAAEQLRISPRVLNHRIHRYGIKHGSWRINRPKETASILNISANK